MDSTFLKNGRFWGASLVALLGTGLFFAWELNYLSPLGLRGLQRPPVSTNELIFIGILTLLFSINIGLFYWRKKYGTCPRGVRRATGIAGAIGAVALICPACALSTIGFAGITFSLIVLSPFLPLFQIIAIILLCVSLFLLIPRSPKKLLPKT